MTQEEIDIMWQQAMRESIKDGEMFTRYQFAKLVAAAEREACAQIVNDDRGLSDDDAIRVCRAIRARGQP